MMEKKRNQMDNIRIGTSSSSPIFSESDEHSLDPDFSEVHLITNSTHHH